MEFDEKQMNTITGLVQKALAELVKSDDFLGAITEATNSAASKTVNAALTSKFKSERNKFETRMAELIAEAVPKKEEDDDDPDGKGKKTPPGEPDVTKSKAYRDLNRKHEALAKEVTDERAKGEAISVQAFNKERDAELLSFATLGKAIDPENIRDALRANVSRDDDGSLVVKTTDKEGVETVQTTGEVVEAYLKARPHLVKASGGGGAGSGEGGGGGAGGGGGDEELKIEDLRDPEKYKKLRAAGKIPGVPAAPKSP